MEEQYNVYFAGQVMDGVELSDVRSKLAKVFSADKATLDKLFSGKPQLIKRECDKATALKFKQALERAGAIPIIKRAELAAAPTNTTPAPPMTAAEKIAALAAAPDEARYQQRSQAPTPSESRSESAAAASGIVLAPPGTDVLREHERAEPAIREVDTSKLAVDSAAERLSPEPSPAPAAPDTGHLSMSDVGETIPNLDSRAHPVSPNLDGLALSEPGTDFSDCAKPEPLDLNLDLNHLTALPPGDKTVDEQQRRPVAAPAPNIDHISLED